MGGDAAGGTAGHERLPGPHFQAVALSAVAGYRPDFARALAAGDARLLHAGFAAPGNRARRTERPAARPAFPRGMAPPVFGTHADAGPPGGGGGAGLVLRHRADLGISNHNRRRAGAQAPVEQGYRRDREQHFVCARIVHFFSDNLLNFFFNSKPKRK